MKDEELTEEALNGFLNWLDENREQAGVKYENFRRRLINYFARRGCVSPETLADDTLNRVIRRLPTFQSSYSGDPMLYIHGVAKKVFQEYLAKPVGEPVSLLDILNSTPKSEIDDELQRMIACLESCLKSHPPEKVRLFIAYYLVEKQGKADYHERLAEQAGLTLNALRLQIFHLKEKLRLCIAKCMKKI